jgi:phospholipase/carboxylesterase
VLVTKLIPAAQRDSRRLMLVLHGLGDSMAGYMWLPEMLGLPWLNYLLVNAPDSYYGGFSWYDFAGEPAPGIIRSRKLLFDLADQQRQEGWPTDQTTVFGFSQGCLMTWELGLHYPHLFAGLIGVSGYAHEPENMFDRLSTVAKQQRFLITHGTRDNLIPFPQVRAQVQALKNAGLQIEWREFHKDHTIAGKEEIDVIREFVQRAYGS